MDRPIRCNFKLVTTPVPEKLNRASSAVAAPATIEPAGVLSAANEAVTPEAVGEVDVPDPGLGLTTPPALLTKACVIFPK